MKPTYIPILFAAFSIVDASAVGETVQEQLPKKGQYEFVKKEANPINAQIFELNEAEKSKKAIFLCTPNFFSFTVNALWDLEIKSKKQANQIAREFCEERLAGYVLLGYKINKDIKL